MQRKRGGERMTTKENARAGIAVPAQAVENGSVCETAQSSTENDTTPAAERQPFQISDLLSTGQENARPLRYLKEV